MPLHLLLHLALPAAAEGPTPRRPQAAPRWRQVVALAVLALVLWGGWQLAAATAAQLQPGDVPAY